MLAVDLRLRRADQIIVAHSESVLNKPVDALDLLDFTPPSLKPQEKTSYVFKNDSEVTPAAMKVKTGKFGFSGQSVRPGCISVRHESSPNIRAHKIPGHPEPNPDTSPGLRIRFGT